MNIVLLGANGKTGREFLSLALNAGYSVTGLVRSAESLDNIKNDRLTVKVGNVCDPAFLESVLPGHDAVVSTVGPRLPTRTACKIYSESGSALVEAMGKTGLKRVLVTSTALLFPSKGFVDRILRLIARNNFKAAGVMEDRIKNADLDYTFARPGFLTNSNETDYRQRTGEMPPGGSSISRKALAQFLMTELQDSAYVGKAVGVCSAEAEIAHDSQLA